VPEGPVWEGFGRFDGPVWVGGCGGALERRRWPCSWRAGGNGERLLLWVWRAEAWCGWSTAAAVHEVYEDDAEESEVDEVFWLADDIAQRPIVEGINAMTAIV